MTGHDSRIPDWLERGVRLHQAERHSDAVRFYDKILEQDPENPDALNLKGLILSGLGRFADAVALFDRSIAALPTFPDVHVNRADALARLDRKDEALESYAQALRLNPAHPAARLNAGTLLHEMGRTDEAIIAFRAMTQSRPDDPRAFYNLGTSLSKRLAAAPEQERDVIANEALSALTRTLELEPDNTDATLALAEIYGQRGAYGRAADQIRAALRRGNEWPDARRAEVLSTLGEHLRKDRKLDESIEAHREAAALSRHHLIRFNLAAALYEAGHLDEAEALYKDVIATDPDFIRAYINLANIHRDRNEYERAISLLEHALTIAPLYQAYTNIAAALGDLGWLTTSLIVHNKAISLGPLNAATRYNRAMTALQLGQFGSGWADHESRFDAPHVSTVRRPGLPEWRGEDLTGKRLLVWTEQGVGDEILLGSMIPDVVARADHVVIECVGRMAPIFARSFPGTTVVGRTRALDIVTRGEDCDYQIATGSLGQHLRPDFQSFPRRSSFLKADPATTGAIRQLYEAQACGRRIVGIAWRSKNPKSGANKSADLAHLGPILRTPGILFVNLQYGDCASDLAEARERFGADILHDASVDPLVDMDRFFAQVAAMDLVITTSNTTAHVAGSQGVPTWLLLPRGQDTLWYWFLHRTDSPWYSSVTLERADGISGNEPWETAPVARAGLSLAHWAGLSRPTGGP